MTEGKTHIPECLRSDVNPDKFDDALPSWAEEEDKRETRGEGLKTPAEVKREEREQLMRELKEDGLL